MPGWKKNIPACLQADQEGGMKSSALIVFSVHERCFQWRVLFIVMVSRCVCYTITVDVWREMFGTFGATLYQLFLVTSGLRDNTAPAARNSVVMHLFGCFLSLYRQFAGCMYLVSSFIASSILVECIWTFAFIVYMVFIVYMCIYSTWSS